MKSAIEAHVQAMRDRGLRPTSIARAEHHLRRFFALARNGARPIRWLTPARAGELYRDAQVGAAVDSHRNALAAARALGAWLVDLQWVKANPFATVKPLGRRRHGKPQLGIDEARKLLGYIVTHPVEESIAAACCLLLGVRTTELVTRDVRHLDDDGRIMRVTASKTAAGLRALEVPEVLRATLLELVRGRAPTDPIFTGARGRRDRTWVTKAVHATCIAAGVPRVSAHGLRGTHATTADRAAQTPEAVAEALGHSSPAITRRAYTDRASSDAARARRGWAVLDGGLVTDRDRSGTRSDPSDEKVCERRDLNPDDLSIAGT